MDDMPLNQQIIKYVIAGVRAGLKDDILKFLIEVRRDTTSIMLKCEYTFIISKIKEMK